MSPHRHGGWWQIRPGQVLDPAWPAEHPDGGRRPWNTTATPSEVACTSDLQVSIAGVDGPPERRHRVLARRCAAPPRWANAIGRGASRYAYRWANPASVPSCRSPLSLRPGRTRTSSAGFGARCPRPVGSCPGPRSFPFQQVAAELWTVGAGGAAVGARPVVVGSMNRGTPGWSGAQGSQLGESRRGHDAVGGPLGIAHRALPQVDRSTGAPKRIRTVGRRQIDDTTVRTIAKATRGRPSPRATPDRHRDHRRPGGQREPGQAGLSPLRPQTRGSRPMRPSG